MEGFLISKIGFDLINLEGNFEFGYKDIKKISMRCKFSNCSHTNCAVKRAISDGALSEEVVNSYYRDFNEAHYVSKQKNKTKAIDYMKQLKLFTKP
ncbi:hypothetical protein QP042_16705 [Bacillus bombysepticus]|nr:hypothetical protein QP042_16705 [Bacillus bombysepticus]